MASRTVLNRDSLASNDSVQSKALSAIERTASTAAKLAKRVLTLGSTPGDATLALDLVRQLQSAATQLSDLTPQLASIERKLVEDQGRQVMELESSLRTELAAKGWRVDGVWPTLYVERGPAVEIDDAARSVSVGGTRLAGLSAPSIVSALDPIVQGLIDKKFTAAQFVADLAAAYDGIEAKSPQVPIYELYRAVVTRMQGARFWRDARSEAFKGMTMDQFRARLSRMLEDGVTAPPDGRELRLLPPLDPKDGIFVYQPSERRFGFVGRVEFVRISRPQAA